MSLYTVVVYDLMVSIKEDNHVPKNIKGDNLRFIGNPGAQIHNHEILIEHPDG